MNEVVYQSADFYIKEAEKLFVLIDKEQDVSKKRLFENRLLEVKKRLEMELINLDKIIDQNAE